MHRWPTLLQLVGPVYETLGLILTLGARMGALISPAALTLPCTQRGLAVAPAAILARHLACWFLIVGAISTYLAS